MSLRETTFVVVRVVDVDEELPAARASVLGADRHLADLDGVRPGAHLRLELRGPVRVVAGLGRAPLETNERVERAGPEEPNVWFESPR
jgi:hypothetical protein